MNTLEIIKVTGKQIEAKNVPAILDVNSVPFQAISSVNWKAYPYKPLAEFRIAHSDQELLLNFKVRENHVQACYTKDGDNVWEDSCVEFFIAFEDDISYYNIECNCIGTLLVSTGIDRNRQPVPMNLLKKIKRWSNIGAEPVNKKKSEGIEWELALIAPKEIFCLHRLEHFSGLRAKGNFYKCGDNLEIPHFLSWSPIQSDTPNFHLPSFFGEFFFNY